MKKKELLFTLTKKDFRVDTFRAGGKGGQKQNKTSSGVRITHPASHAVGESREHASQLQNKKAAFRRMADTKKFKVWIRMQVAAQAKGYADIERLVDDAIKPHNIKVETYDPNEI